MDDTREPLGELIDNLGIVADFTPYEHVTDAIVILKSIQAATGDVQVQMVFSPGTDWVTRTGLMKAAQEIADATPFVMSDEDDGDEPDAF
jgi:hypothetical protein